MNRTAVGHALLDEPLQLRGARFDAERTTEARNEDAVARGFELLGLDSLLERVTGELVRPERAVELSQQVVGREIAVLEQFRNEITYCDEQLATILPSTPAGVLATIPGVGVATASYYGAALGDPWRFTNADAAYRYSGLSPSSYDSAGRRRAKVQISRQGAVELRRAMITLGTSMGLSHPDFVAYRRRLLAAGKKPMVVAVALAHRSHRLAFAMMRSQIPYDDCRWATVVAKGRPAKAAGATATT